MNNLNKIKNTWLRKRDRPRNRTSSSSYSTEQWVTGSIRVNRSSLVFFRRAHPLLLSNWSTIVWSVCRLTHWLPLGWYSLRSTGCRPILILFYSSAWDCCHYINVELPDHELVCFDKFVGRFFALQNRIIKDKDLAAVSLTHTSIIQYFQ